MMPSFVHALLQNESRPLIRAGIATIALSGVAAVVSGSWALAIACTVVTCTLIYAQPQLQSDALQHSTAARSIALMVMAAAIVGSVIGDSPLVFWWYLVPPLMISVLPFRAALLVLAVTLVGVWLLSLMTHLGPTRHQLWAGLVMTSTVIITLSYLRNIKERQLRPLRRTDTLTQASTLEHLEADLATEIVRSEREGTDLTIVALAIDGEGLNLLPAPDQRTVVAKTGRLLHTELRIFETYYRTADAEFLILLPHADTATATKTAGRLRQKIRKAFQDMDVTITASAGVTGLNVGDDARSLLDNASRALSSARKQGNKTHTHSATIDSDDTSHE